MRRRVTSLTAIGMALLVLLVAGCGQKGPLYLPDPKPSGPAPAPATAPGPTR